MGRSKPRFTIRRFCRGDYEEWAEMRMALFPTCGPAAQRRELAELLADPRDQPAWMAESGDGRLIGFLVASVRNYAEGCGRRPVGYLEEWFVRPGFRRHGVGRAMVRAAERWAARRGFRHMASDTEIENRASERAHLAMGYDEVQRGIHFMKRLPSRRGARKRGR